MSSDSSLLLDEALLKCRNKVNFLMQKACGWFCVAHSSSQDQGTMSSFLCPTVLQSHVVLLYCTGWGLGLLFLCSQDPQDSQIFFQPKVTLRKICLSCRLKVTQEARKETCLLMARVQRHGEKQQHWIPGDNLCEIRSKGWSAQLGQCRMPLCTQSALSELGQRFHAFQAFLGSQERLQLIMYNKTKSELFSYSLIVITSKCTNTFSSTSLHQLIFC